MATKIQIRRDTAANWRNANPVLSQGEPAYEIDTQITKYGDGVTAYKDLPSSTGTSMTAWSGNKWQFDSSAGGKSFTYKTSGHVRTDVRLTQAMVDSIFADGTMIVSVTEHPTIIDSVKTAWDNWDDSNGSRPYWFYNGSWYDIVNNYSLNGDLITINLDSTYEFSVGDIIQFAGWSKGTQALYDSYRSTVGVDGDNLEYTGTYWQPTTTTSNTNTVSVDFTGQYGSWQNTLLLDGAGKNFIVFDPYTNNNGRKITNATLVSGNTFAITFDGPPVDLKAKTAKTLVCKPSVDANMQFYLRLSKQEYPELMNYFNIDDNTNYFTINDDPTQIPVYYFWPRNGNGYEYNGVDYHNNWVLGTDTEFSVLATDTITLHYWEKPTIIRMDYWVPLTTLRNEDYNTSYDHGYRWFSWEEDLPHYKDAKGNGVQGGWLDYHVQVTWPDGMSRNSDNRTFSVFFDPKGSNNYRNDFSNGLNDFRYQGFPSSHHHHPQPNDGYDGNFGGSWNDLQFATLWDFYEDGIFFHAHNYKYDDGNQQEIKVDIMWNARIFYADTPMLEPRD